MLLAFAGCKEKESTEKAQEIQNLHLGLLEKSESEEQALDQWYEAVNVPENERPIVSQYSSIN